MFTELPITEEIKSLRTYYLHINQQLGEATDLPQPDIDELQALQTYISIRLVNLKNKLKEQS